MEKLEEIKNKPKLEGVKIPEDDLKFILRRAELTKELIAFLKYISQ